MNDVTRSAEHTSRLRSRSDVCSPYLETSIIRALLRAGTGVSLLSSGSFQSDVRHGDLIAKPLQPRAYWPLALVRPSTGSAPSLRDLIASELLVTVRKLVIEKRWPGGTVFGRLPKTGAGGSAGR